VKLSTIQPLIRFLISKIGSTFLRSIGPLHAVRLTRVLAPLKLDALQRIQTACGMVRLAEGTHLVLVTEIRLRVKLLHIIPVAAEIM
jgi:hypothetical protein